MNCVYCGRKIEIPSEEHIIQSRLGGIITSPLICCRKCNNDCVSKFIDSPFEKSLSSITSNIKNIYNENQNGCIWEGKALYNDKVYPVKIKKNKVIYCNMLKEEMKEKWNHSILSEMKICDLDTAPDIKNKYFTNGICKIAINFALSLGISQNIACQYLKTEKIKNNDSVEVQNILLENNIVQFVPVTTFDDAIEFMEPFLPNSQMDIYHLLILFNIKNELWCYVDLFNTFQFYVLVSDKWDSSELYKTYFQMVQKKDIDIPSFTVRTVKDTLIQSNQYKYELTYDQFKNQFGVLKFLSKGKKGRNCILEQAKKSNKTLKNKIESFMRQDNKNIDAIEYISNLATSPDFIEYVKKNIDNNELVNGTDILHDLSFYLKNDKLRENIYKRYFYQSYTDHFINISYPNYIKKNEEKISLYSEKYYIKKFKRLVSLMGKI